MKTPASEVIRKTALKILIENPSGMRLSDLKFSTEKVLEEFIEPDNSKNGKFRSALWDLEKRYPEYVLKEKQEKSAVFFPTEKLQNDIEDIVIPKYSPTARQMYEEMHSRGENKYRDYVEMKAKIMDVIELIEEINLDGFDIKTIENSKEATDIVKALIYLEGLKDLKYSMQNVQSQPRQHSRY
ncbi:hypothetical protein HPL003_11270 [Paenibacillus terrae HPL-003]|uniref:Uncharacterized protein n=1 Tax=Paenibacillus terrae (strain HPL-003) TaxID=985665 RepID=G7VYM1_PAETH|nr:hypothetical protein [Paenibacillus terrae]AET59011.1 hypothetical protein HPL003_11270 [Paenibacillus terrae HPL-003]